MVAAVFAGEGLESLRRFPQTGREAPAGRVPVMSVLDSIRSIACTVLASQSCKLLQILPTNYSPRRGPTRPRQCTTEEEINVPYPTSSRPGNSRRVIARAESD
ncbi:hypothetical protein GCM10010464_29260 [Pseudonocardia yunnanensis]